MTFSQFNLSPDISKAITACGYTNPTPIQTRSIPDILNGKDLVASAQTGTGKTAAFVLPALQRLSLSQTRSNKPRVLILTPTRELATQISDAVKKYGKFLRIKSVNLVGGMPYGQQIRDLSRVADIIIATPGRLLDHMQNRRCDLSGIEMLILDEADRMLDMGFIDDVNQIANSTPKQRQTLLFSATVDNNLSRVIRQLLKNPTHIDLSHETLTPKQIKQEIYYADNIQHKMKLLQHFLKNENVFKAIIFSATKIHAEQLSKQLIREGYQAAALHGDLRQNVRNRTIELMHKGKIQFLVATDVAARGINVVDITHVFNFDLPKFAEDYVHRIGRTGRAGKTGIAISFALPADARHLQKIERFISMRISTATIPGLEATKRHSSSPAPGNTKKRHKPKFNDSKPKFGKSKSRFDDAKPIRDGAKSRFNDSRSKYDDRSDTRFDDSKPRFDKSKSRFDDSKPKRDGAKSRFNDSRSKYSDRSDTRFDDSKPRFDRSKSRFDDSKPKRDGAKSRFNDSRSKDNDRSDTRFDDSKPRFDRSKSRFDDSKPKRDGAKSRFNDSRSKYDDRPSTRFDDSKPRFNKSKSRFDDDAKPKFGKSKSRFNDSKPKFGKSKDRFSDSKPKSKSKFHKKRFKDDDLA